MKSLRCIPRSRLGYAVPKGPFKTMFMVNSIEVVKLWRLCYMKTLTNLNVGLQNRTEERLFKNIYAGGMTANVEEVGETEMSLAEDNRGLSFHLKNVSFIADPRNKTIYLHVPSLTAFEKIAKTYGKSKDIPVPPPPFPIPPYLPFSS